MIKYRIRKEVETIIYIEKFLIKKDVTKPDVILNNFFKRLKDNFYYCIEDPYVDRVYRDTYYNYYSSKRKRYGRDCLRVSIFRGRIVNSDFTNPRKFQKLNDLFYGFFIIRPLSKCIGRNIIHPYALKKNDFFIRAVETTINVLGVKLKAFGFPHCTQDSESMSCAETTIWSLLEYFGNRYDQYSTTLPSQIKQGFRNGVSSKKMMPSTGLDHSGIINILEHSGFKSKFYSKITEKTVDGYEDDTFYATLNTYIESGIPVILGLSSNDIGHVVIAIGRKWIDLNEIKKSHKVEEITNCKVYDFDHAERDIIVIDDNHPPYQSSPTSEPTKYYPNRFERKNWKNCEINYFIVPLPDKIYLDAAEAKSCFYDFIQYINKEDFHLNKTRVNFVRFFLTTSRSLKDNLLNNESFLNEDLKDIIIRYQLPRFIWVAEISEEALFTKYRADGIVIIDATEKDIQDFNPIILAAANNMLLVQNTKKEGHSSLDFEKKTLDLQPFKMFNDNLKLYNSRNEEKRIISQLRARKQKENAGRSK